MDRNFHCFLRQKIDQHELDFLIKYFNEKLGLSFYTRRAYYNLCLINSDDLRMDYKSFFGIEELEKFLKVQGIDRDNFEYKKFNCRKPVPFFGLWYQIKNNFFF